MTGVSASIICMDPLNMETHAREMGLIGVDQLHVDIMDGHYVPRIGIYPEIVHRLSDVTDLPLDIHLMVDDPEFVIGELKGARIRNVSVHAEHCGENILRVVDRIHAIDAAATLAFNLSVDTGRFRRVFNSGEIEGVLFMGIHPGVLKQDHRPQSVVAECRRLIGDLPESFEPCMVQCDGGVNFQSIPDLIGAGVNDLVCGTSTLYAGVDFKSDFEQQSLALRQNITKIRQVVG